MTTIEAVYENGVFRPLTTVDLRNGTRVTVAPVAAPPLADLLTELEKLPDNPDAPTDQAAQHDHYLYGTPKRL